MLSDHPLDPEEPLSTFSSLFAYRSQHFRIVQDHPDAIRERLELPSG
jgi:hypothetical protein